MPLTAELGNRNAGELIRSQDWNALVAGVDRVESTLGARVDRLEEADEALDARLRALEARLTREVSRLDGEVAGLRTELAQQVEELDARITELEGQVAAVAPLVPLRAPVQKLLEETYRVHLGTQRSDYALGEMVEITAEIRDVEGKLVTFSGREPRPWVDFVSTWGQLKAASGFSSRGGVGDRTISVQVNSQGIARVRIQSEVVEDMSDDAEAEISSALSTRVEGNKTIAQLVLESNTPEDQAVRTAYRALTKKYDDTGSTSVRSYVDTYYLKNGTRIGGKANPAAAASRRQRWRDYRTTVMAFANVDDSSSTADATRGVSSIQITFRDWITPWIVVDYFAEIPVFLPQVQEHLTDAAKRGQKDFLVGIQEEVALHAREGVVGSMRGFQAVDIALGGMKVPDPSGGFETVKNSARAALAIQQSLQTTTVTAPGAARNDLALQAIAAPLVQAGTRAAEMNDAVSSMQQKLDDVKQGVDRQVRDLEGKVKVVETRANTIVSQGNRLDAQIQEVSSKMGKLNQINPEEVHNTLALVKGLDVQVRALRK